MKAFFTYTRLPYTYPSFPIPYIKKKMSATVFKKLGIWKEDVNMPEDLDSQGNYVEDFKESNVLLIYRRSFMSFVDHYVALRL